MNKGISIKDAMESFNDTLDEKHENKENFGHPIGLKDIDNHIGGLEEGTLTVIASRPGVGKSIFLQNILENLILNQKLTAVLFSLELTPEQYCSKMISSVSRVYESALKRPSKITDNDVARIVAGSCMISRSNLSLYEISCLEEILLEIKARKESEPSLKVVAIDSIQLVRCSLDATYSEKLSFIMCELKAIAKELQLILIVTSHVNRSVEQRDDKRPNLSDCRGCGSIEEIADLVFLLFRNPFDEDLKVEVAKSRLSGTGLHIITLLPMINRVQNHFRMTATPSLEEIG